MGEDILRDQLINAKKELRKILDNFYGFEMHKVETATETITRQVKQGGKLLIMGNGGSAADAQHFTTELVCTFENKDRKALPAICLNTNTSILTAWSNDFGFNTVFARQIEALAQKDDIIIGITTSGNSRNIINAFQTAKKKGCTTIALTGQTGGQIKKIADITIKVPSKNTPRIQEMHIFIIHNICKRIEGELT